MKLVSNDYKVTFERVLRAYQDNYRGIYPSYLDDKNIEVMNSYEDKDRLNRLFSLVEDNYDSYHNEDEYTKYNYFFKLLTIINNHNNLITNLSDEDISLITTEIPFEVDTDKHLNRLKLLCNSEILSEVKLLSNRFLPSDVISIFLQRFDQRNMKRINDDSLNKYRDSEIDKLEKNKHKYLEEDKLLSTKEYREYLNKEEKVNELK